ncbi:MAG: hypothetical protein OEY07_10040 [Gammaproteobacteria bacterium]|nr:hypothetical protein [Gammaproteobacteria bacterium]
MNKITFFANGEPIHEFERSAILEERQRGFLDKMDSDMEKGIRINGQLISNPQLQQRARFVALNLLKALHQDNHAVIGASSTWLAERKPNLIEVRYEQQADGINVEFIETQ